MAQKQYIGSGKKHENYNSVTVTLNLDQAQKHAYETSNGTFLTFIVSARKEADQYGKTHSVFVLVDADEPETTPAAVAEPEAAPKKKKARSKK